MLASWNVLLSLWLASSSGTALTQSVPLDFLAGKWALLNADGSDAGTSCVRLDNGMISEVRRDNEGDVPLWFFQSERNGGWTQLFPAPSGELREFTPQSKPGDWPLILGSKVTLKDGRRVTFRLTMKRLEERNSRRHLEMSADDGKTWNTVFDYTYRAVQAGRDGTCVW